MTLASGIFTELRIKKETTWGTLAGTGSAQLLRRVTADIKETRNPITSNEINTSQQRKTFVHGTRRAEGTINGEHSGGTYTMLQQSLLRRDFTALASITGASLTFAGAGPTYTVTRAAGSFLTDGVKVGMVVRVTAGSVNANNLNKNLFVVGVVALTLTVVPWGNGTLTAEGPIASCTIAMPGKRTYVPTSGHTNDSYTIERYASDITRSNVFTGCKIVGADLSLQPGALITWAFNVLGKGYGQAPSGAEYFTSPTAATSSSGVTAVNGVLRAASGQQALVTGLNARIDGAGSVGECIGSNYTPDVFLGPITVNGQMTAYYDGGTFEDTFYNETETSLHLVAYAGTTAAAEFFAFTVPLIKLGAADKSDGPGPTIITCPFEAIENGSGGSGTSSEATTVWIQDSLAA
jgi:hypothetical protein